MDYRAPVTSTPNTAPESIHRLVFNNHRQYPKLPGGYDWETQKRLYSGPNLLDEDLDEMNAGRRRKDRTKGQFGAVFCHRGLYERALGIVDNSAAAIKNGTKEGFFLHELDSFIEERLDNGFMAHDKIARRVTAKGGEWTSYTFQEIIQTSLVTRRVNTEAVKPDFASSFLETDEKVMGLLATLWNHTLGPDGNTLQVDLRDDDFAKAMAFYISHISATNIPRDHHGGRNGTLPWSFFKSTILKGTTMRTPYFRDLESQIKWNLRQFGPLRFDTKHLRLCPPLIIVFYPKTLRMLAEEKKSVNSRSPKESFQHIYDTFMEQVMSFVEVGDGNHFILEIVHSGLGLGYDKKTGKAKNPLDWVPLKDREVIYESCIDRAMIEVSLELRRKYPKLRFSSCTRLPDIITPDGKEYKASYETSRMVKLGDGEAGLSTKLRAMPGGLYPQSDLVVADDPAAEIAARTWIDQVSDLDRSDLLKRPYNKWLATAGRSVVAAISKLNNTDFQPNKAGYPTLSLGTVDAGNDSPMGCDTTIRLWMKALLTCISMGSNNGSRKSGSNNDRAKAACVESNNVSDDDPHFQSPGHFWGSYEERMIVIAGREYRFENDDTAKRAVASLAADAAATRGDVETLAKVISRGAKINDSGAGFCGTLLERTCLNGHECATAFLLDLGAHIHREGVFGSPLEIAAAGGHKNIVKLLFAASERGNPGVEPFTRASITAALKGAARSGHYAVAELLLQRGADIHKAGRWDSPLIAASSNGRTKIVELLFTASERGNPGTKPRPFEKELTRSALEYAILSGHRAVVKLLLDKGAELMDDNLYSPCLRGDTMVVEVLLERGARIHKAGRSGFPLEVASENGHINIVEKLFAASEKGNLGQEPFTRASTSAALQRAARSGQNAVVKLLLDKGAKIDIPVANEYTAGILTLLAKAGIHVPLNEILSYPPQNPSWARTRQRPESRKMQDNRPRVPQIRPIGIRKDLRRLWTGYCDNRASTAPLVSSVSHCSCIICFLNKIISRNIHTRRLSSGLNHPHPPRLPPVPPSYPGAPSPGSSQAKEQAKHWQNLIKASKSWATWTRTNGMSEREEEARDWEVFMKETRNGKGLLPEGTVESQEGREEMRASVWTSPVLSPQDQSVLRARLKDVGPKF
ncbi:hypothetical protein N7454_011059 [Penicillium verhagenii]|nr:hypothetical protein N7454_011059 [Penicillium verhagenii]